MMDQLPNFLPNFCDRCGAKHMPTDLEIIEQKEELVVCQLKCQNCKNSYLIHINSGNGVLSAKRSSTKSEMTKKEFKKFSKSSSISTDEILDVHNLMKRVTSFEDFKVLFGK